MNKNELKKPMILITFAICLYLILANLSEFKDGLFVILRAFKPVFFGIGIAFCLNLLMKSYEKNFLDKVLKKKGKKYKRGISIVLTYLSAIIIITVIVLVIIPKVSESIVSISNYIPYYMENLANYFENVAESLGVKDTIWLKIVENFDSLISNLSKYINIAFSQVYGFTMSVTSSVINVFLGIVFSFYMLFKKENLIAMLKKMTYAFLNKKYADKILKISSDANKIFSSFVGGQITECFILGILCFIGMSIFKMPYAALISVLIGVTGLIPVLGAYLGLIPSTLLIFLVKPMTALWFVIFIIVLQQIEGNLIYPKVVGNAIGLNGLFVMIAITLGGAFFGAIGILLSVPTMAVIYALVRDVVNNRLNKKDVKSS